MSDDDVRQRPARGRRGRPRILAPGDQRDRALAAARDILLAEGYGGMTMDAVARRAQLSKKTLYEIFASKAQLVGALVAAHRRSILDLPCDSDEPPEQAIRRMFRVDADAGEAVERDGLIRLIVAESGAHPELHDIFVAHGPHAAETELTDWIAGQVERGRLVTDDPRACAGVLLDMMFGAMMARPHHGATLDRRRRIDAAIAVFLDGTRARIDPPQRR